MAVCNICDSRLQTHSRAFSCSIGSASYHINCLPFVTKDDSIYVDRKLDTWVCIKRTGELFPFKPWDDNDDFIESLSEYWRLKPTISYTGAKEKMFLPFELNTDPKTPLFDVDPDFNLYNKFYSPCLLSCEYYTEDTFNAMCSKITYLALIYH